MPLAYIQVGLTVCATRVVISKVSAVPYLIFNHKPAILWRIVLRDLGSGYQLDFFHDFEVRGALMEKRREIVGKGRTLT